MKLVHELVRYPDGSIKASAGHPDHLTVGAVERCDECLRILFTAMDRLDRMEGRTR